MYRVFVAIIITISGCQSLSHLYILALLSISQVAASRKLNGVPLLSVSPCLHWARASGDLVSHWKPSSGSTIRVFSQYFSMVLSRDRFLRKELWERRVRGAEGGRRGEGLSFSPPGRSLGRGLCPLPRNFFRFWILNI